MTGKNPNQRGFTLIELLVVVSIIGLLGSIAVTSLNSARERGRIAKRLGDLRQLELAVNLYYEDFGYYPRTPSDFWRSPCSLWGGTSDWIPGLTPDYTAALPVDPQHDPSTGTECYLYRSYQSGAHYKLVIPFNAREMRGTGSNNDYNKYPERLDPRRDAGSQNCAVEAGNNAWGWASYTSDASCL